MGISLNTKIKVINTKVHPMAFFGAENASPTEQQIAAYTTQVLRCISGKQQLGELDLKFASIESTSKDLDPATKILVHRVNAMRRELVKKPELKQKVEAIIRKCRSWRIARLEVQEEQV